MNKIKNKLASALPETTVASGELITVIVKDAKGGEKTMRFEPHHVVKTEDGDIEARNLTHDHVLSFLGKPLTVALINGQSAPVKEADAEIAKIEAETEAEVEAIENLDLDDENDGAFEEREAYLQRLAADIGPDDISPDEDRDDDFDDFDLTDDSVESESAEDDFNDDIIEEADLNTDPLEDTSLGVEAYLAQQEEAEIAAAVDAISDEQLLAELGISVDSDDELPVEETPEEKEDREFLEEFNGLIDQILEYELPAERESLRSLYEHMTMRDLRERLDLLTELLGSPDCAKLVKEAAEEEQRARNSTRVQKTLQAFELNRTDFIKMINRIEEAVGVDSVFRKALNPKYHDAAKEAIVEQAVLRQAIAEIMQHNGWNIVPETATFNDLLAGLKYAANMFHVNHVKLADMVEARKKTKIEVDRAHENTRYHAERATQLSNVIDDIRADFARRIIPENTRCFLADTTGKNFLADENYARKKQAKLDGEFDGKVTYSRNLHLRNLTWVQDDRLAMRFKHPEQALIMLEDIIEASQEDMPKNARGEIDINEVRVAGQGLKNIQVAVRGTILLDREGVKAFDKK